VEPGSHAYSSPSGVSSPRQRSSPVKTSAYVEENISPLTDVPITWSISSRLGQRSRRKTSSPSGPSPSGSFTRSMSIRAPSPYATTGGGGGGEVGLPL